MKHTLNTAVAMVLYAGLVVWAYYYGINWWLFPIPGLIWFMIAGLGSGFVSSNYHVKALCRAKTEEKKVAITFDDGPHPETLKVLDLLKQYNAKGTFFCIGSQIEKHPEIFTKTVSEGHTAGNHTFTHSPKTGFFTTQQVIEELRHTDEAIEKLSGKKVKLFRPPFGVTSPSIAKALRRTGHTVIGWNIRSLDTVIKNEKRIFNRIKSRLKPGSIILLHDTSSRSVNVLEQLLVLLQENGYEAITVDELLNIEAYEK